MVYKVVGVQLSNNSCLCVISKEDNKWQTTVLDANTKVAGEVLDHMGTSSGCVQEAYW